MDRFGRGVDESVQLSRGLMAEHGPFAGAEYRGPQPGAAGRRAVKYRVDAPVELLPAPALEAPFDQLTA